MKIASVYHYSDKTINLTVDLEAAEKIAGTMKFVLERWITNGALSGENKAEVLQQIAEEAEGLKELYEEIEAVKAEIAEEANEAVAAILANENNEEVNENE